MHSSFLKKPTVLRIFMLAFLVSWASTLSYAQDARQVRRDKELKQLNERFQWWPTDASPAPVKDQERGGYWWWPEQPGQMRPWGNRGYVYVYKIIYDYKAKDIDEEVVKPLEQVVEKPIAKEVEVEFVEPKPSLLIKKIIKNIKIYFDYNKADLRDDHIDILIKAVKTLERNPDADILITGNCDARGSVEYNDRLGKKRGESVEKFMLDHGVKEDRIKILSRGKLDAVAPISDVIGMQKDRNAQFMIAEVEEVMIPGKKEAVAPQGARKLDEGRYIIEEKTQVESQPKAATREYVIQKNDSLWKIAEREMGSGNRWKYLYEMNKDVLLNPSKLKAGVKIKIPVE